jgi:hypothetical protein
MTGMTTRDIQLDMHSRLATMEGILEGLLAQRHAEEAERKLWRRLVFEMLDHVKRLTRGKEQLLEAIGRQALAGVRFEIVAHEDTPPFGMADLTRALDEIDRCRGARNAQL